MIVAYIRVSTQEQVDRGYGLDVQTDIINSYSSSNNLTIDKFYIERGVSGSLIDRPVLAELLTDISSAGIKKVIIVRLDRLARDLLVQESILADFKSREVEIISIDEPDILSTDPSRVLFRQIQGAINQYEKTMINARLKAGRIKKASSGGYAGGSPGYGYKVIKDGKNISVLEIDNNEAEVIRLIQELRVNGNSYAKIATHLNNSGVKTKKNKSWYPQTVRTLLNSNNVYGIVKYNDMRTNGIHENILSPAEVKIKSNYNKELAVKTIIELRSKGNSLKTIARKLNRKKIATKLGGKWKPGTIKWMLDNYLLANL